MRQLNTVPLLKTIINGATDVGLVREVNEDSYVINESLGFAIIADGLGGHAAGEIASKVAVEFVANELVQPGRDLCSFSANDVAQYLVRAVATANGRIFELSQKHREMRGMGTTLDAVVLVNDTAFIAHIGDSRVYHIQKGTARLLTRDHTLRADLVDQGQVTPDELRAIQNVLSRALGTEREVLIDSLRVQPHRGDALVLCTDGVWSYFESSPSSIAQLVKAHGAGAAAELVRQAIERGGDDNATAVVMVFVGRKAA